jgi:HEAT repeat protein
MDELESQIRLLQHPSGHPFHEREAARALAFLLDRADEAYPRLLRLLKSNRADNPAALLDVLPSFGRAESVPVLGEVLARGTETLSGAAASALARHPQEAAFETLVRALALPEPASVVAAADALLLRGDARACAALARHLRASDANVRYHVVQAAAGLGCLGAEELRTLAAEDPDADVRALAGRAAKGG